MQFWAHYLFLAAAVGYVGIAKQKKEGRK